MKARVTSSASFWAALLGSLGAHAAVSVVGFGHAAPTSLRAAQVTESAVIAVDREIEAPALEADSPSPAAPTGAPSAPAHTHTHSYPVPLDHDAHPHDPSLVHVVAAPAFVAHPAAAELPEAPALPRFVLGAASPANAPAGAEHLHAETGHTEGTGALSDGAGEGTKVADEGAVDVRARCEMTQALRYTALAEQAGIEADVPLEIVVDARGNVQSARVLKSVGYGLDQRALDGVKSLKCEPAQRGGATVAVRMHHRIQFRL